MECPNSRGGSREGGSFKKKRLLVSLEEINRSRKIKDFDRTGNIKKQDAAMGIRTPVAGVKGPHDWPDYTIAASCSL
jgi:hypothetical protein